MTDLVFKSRHSIMCGDSTNEENVKRLMGNEKAKILFTSPPYSDMRDYEGCDTSLEYLKNFIPRFKDYCELFFINLGIKRKEGRIIPYWNDYLEIADKEGLKLLSWLVWSKGEAGSIANQTAMFSIEHEWIFVLGRDVVEIKKTEECKNAGTINNHSYIRQKDGSLIKQEAFYHNDFKQMGTVISLSPQKARNISSEHPAVFPEKLPEKFILASTNENDLVIDTFLGYGTTLIAAEKTNRKCFGMEISERYCDLTVQRFADFTHQSDNIYLERDGEKIPYTQLLKQ